MVECSSKLHRNMGFGRIFSTKFLVPSCLKPQKFKASADQVLQRRLSFSDLSVKSSLSVITNISHSCGSNLQTFSFNELKTITQSFNNTNYLGEGGFGPVFKGFIHDNFKPGLISQHVAVKILDLDGSQGHREWLAEVFFLGQLRHPNLVNLIGYCIEDEQRLLVYEFLEGGNLENLLFQGYVSNLGWLERMKIALGAAKGLAFLHEAEKPVIYRDFKSSNILLDSDYNAKLSDFGLATDGPEGDETHITTRVMGTEGYAAPEYIMTGHLSTMSDVFSFGVFLLELLTGRRAVDKSRPSREQNLVLWARHLLKDPHKLDKIIDPKLENRYSNEASKTVAALAYRCLSHHPKCRPAMRAVVQSLEPLMDMKDFLSEPFVFVFSKDVCSKDVCSKDVGSKDKDVCSKDVLSKDDVKKKEEECKLKDEKACKFELEEKNVRSDRKCRRRRNATLRSRSRAVHSDTALYKTLGSSLYSSAQQKEIV